MKIKSSIEPKFAAVTFPKMISDGQSFILLSVVPSDEEGELDITLRIGGELMQSEAGEMNRERIAHLLKTAGALVAEEDDDNIVS